MVRGSLLKVLEEDVIDIIVVYRGELNEDFIKELLSFINEQAIVSRKRRFVFHVFNDREPPQYLEDLRPILQNNVLYTITTRYHRLRLDDLRELLKQLEEGGHKAFFFIQNKLVDFIKIVGNTKFQLIEFE